MSIQSPTGIVIGPLEQTELLFEQYQEAQERLQACKKLHDCSIIGQYTKEKIQHTIKELGEKLFQRIGEYAQEAGKYYAEGYYHYSILCLKCTLIICKKLHGENSQEVKEILHKIGDIYFALADYTNAHLYCDKALKQFKTLTASHYLFVATVHEKKGIFYFARNDFLNALKHFQIALQINEKFDFNYLNLVDSYLSVSFAYQNLGKCQEALGCLFRILTIWKKYSGDNHFKIAEVLQSISNVYKDLGEYRNAIDIAKQALRIAEQYCERDGQLWTLIVHIGKVYKLKGATAKAIKFFKRALEIIKQLSVIDDPRVPNILSNIVHLYLISGQNQEACKYLDLVIKVNQKELGKDSTDSIDHVNMGYIYFTLGNYPKALDFYNSALPIRKKLDIRASKIFSNIGYIYERQKKYSDALENFKQAHKIYVEYYGKKFHESCELQLKLGIILIKLGLAGNKQIVDHYKEGIQHLNELVEIDREILTKNLSALQPHDLLGQARLLQILSRAYIWNGQFLEAAKLYDDQAHFFSEEFPVITQHYIRLALKIYSYCPGTLEKQGNLYYLRAKLSHQFKQLDFAIRSLQKALQYHDKGAWKNQLHEWICERKEILSNMDLDFYSQIQRVRDSYRQIMYLYTFYITGSRLSFLANLITQLAIKLQTLLDQGYSRFVRELIYVRNRDAENITADTYYPFQSSKAALLNDFKQKKLLGAVNEVKQDKIKLHIFRNPVNEIIQLLQKYEYLDKEKKVTQKVKEDPDLKQLEDELILDPFRIMLKKLINPTTIGTLVDGRALNTMGINDIQRQLNNLKNGNFTQLFLDKLKKHKILKDNNERNENYIVGRDAFISDSSFIGLGRQFWNCFLDIFVNANKTFSLTDYPLSFRALLQEQPYYYYDNENNEKNPGIWVESWFEKINTINNDSKHVRLTPHESKVRVEQHFGTLVRRKITLFADYMIPKPKLYFWSFVDILGVLNKDQLPAVKGKTLDAKRIQLSHDIIGALKANKYINNLLVTHPDAKAILNAVKNKENKKKIGKMVEEFRQQVYEDLPGTAKPFYYSISNFLIRRVLQKGHIAQLPDTRIEITQLLDNGINGVERILKAFCRDRCTVLGNQPEIDYSYIPNLELERIEKSQLEEQFQALEVQRPSMESLLKKPEKLTLPDLQSFHRWIKGIAIILRFKQEPEQVGVIFERAAIAFSDYLPWLALRYFNQAIEAYSFVPNNDQVRLLEDKREKLFQLAKLFNEAEIYGELEYRELKETPAISKQNENLADERLNHIDEDLRKQLEHAKRTLWNIRYLSFKLTIHPGDQYLKQKIQNLITETIIKVRHLLDQGFGRYVKLCVYRENGCEETQANYPMFASDEELIEGLKKTDRKSKEAAIISEDSNRESLDREKHREVWEAIRRTQPYYRAEKSPLHLWLEQLYTICNQAKHERFTILPDDILLQYQAQPHSLNDLFPLRYIEKRLYPWSFCPFVDGDIRKSEEIYKILKQKNFFNVQNNGPSANTIIIHEKILSLVASLKEDNLEECNAIYTQIQKILEDYLNEILNRRELCNCVKQIADKLIFLGLNQKGYFYYQSQQPSRREIASDNNSCQSSQSDLCLERIKSEQTKWIPATPLLEEAISEVEKLLVVIYKNIDPSLLKSCEIIESISQIPRLQKKSAVDDSKPKIRASTPNISNQFIADRLKKPLEGQVRGGSADAESEILLWYEVEEDFSQIPILCKKPAIEDNRQEASFPAVDNQLEGDSTDDASTRHRQEINSQLRNLIKGKKEKKGCYVLWFASQENATDFKRIWEEYFNANRSNEPLKIQVGGGLERSYTTSLTKQDYRAFVKPAFKS